MLNRTKTYCWFPLGGLLALRAMKLSLFLPPTNCDELIWCTGKKKSQSDTISVLMQRTQNKSNHFYCHITTAQVPWWVEFLWACSRQCRKTTDNLHMNRQCKKNNKQFTYGQTVQKNNKQFTYGQTVQKSNSNLHMDSTYLQTVQKTMCKIHIHILSTLSVL